MIKAKLCGLPETKANREENWRNMLGPYMHM